MQWNDPLRRQVMSSEMRRFVLSTTCSAEMTPMHFSRLTPRHDLNKVSVKSLWTTSRKPVKAASPLPVDNMIGTALNPLPSNGRYAHLFTVHFRDRHRLECKVTQL